VAPQTSAEQVEPSTELSEPHGPSETADDPMVPVFPALTEGDLLIGPNGIRMVTVTDPFVEAIDIREENAPYTEGLVAYYSHPELLPTARLKLAIDAARQPLLNRIAQLEAEVDEQRGKRIVERSKNIGLEERLLTRDRVAARAVQAAEARIAELERLGSELADHLIGIGDGRIGAHRGCGNDTCKDLADWADAVPRAAGYNWDSLG
jgi:hypothetical protein